MKLDRVTITGADDSIDPVSLIQLSDRFPWVEWGILFSRSQEGSPRFPSMSWLSELLSIMDPDLKLSAHLCGAWVRDLCVGRRSFEEERPGMTADFQRAQLNFHGSQHAFYREVMANALKEWGKSEYILQFDAINDGLKADLVKLGVNAVPLFDTSGGAGIEPDVWPIARVDEYSGYAGGLHPDKIGEQLPRIVAAAGDARIWIDIETHVRSDNDAKFDLAKVEKFLLAVQPHVAIS